MEITISKGDREELEKANLEIDKFEVEIIKSGKSRRIVFSVKTKDIDHESNNQQERSFKSRL